MSNSITLYLARYKEKRNNLFKNYTVTQDIIQEHTVRIDSRTEDEVIEDINNKLSDIRTVYGFLIESGDTSNFEVGFRYRGIESYLLSYYEINGLWNVLKCHELQLQIKGIIHEIKNDNKMNRNDSIMNNSDDKVIKILGRIINSAADIEAGTYKVLDFDSYFILIANINNDALGEHLNNIGEYIGTMNGYDVFRSNKVEYEEIKEEA